MLAEIGFFPLTNLQFLNEMGNGMVATNVYSCETFFTLPIFYELDVTVRVGVSAHGLVVISNFLFLMV